MSHMVIENDPSNRMQIRSMGNLQMPGSCYVCGSGNCEDGYLDFGTFVDYHGTFYLCITCAKQAAAVIGFFSPEEVEFLRTSAEKVANDNEQLKQELTDAHEYITSLNSVFNSKFAGNSEPSSSAGVADPNPSKRGEDRESEVTESDPVPGRSNSNGASKRNITFQ